MDKLSYLTEMGVECWRLTRPQIMTGHLQDTIKVESDCKLLFVSSSMPSENEIVFLEKVLSSFDVTLAEIKHVYPDDLSLISMLSDTTWLWFCGCSKPDSLATLVNPILISPYLYEVDGNTAAKRQLWQQISTRKS
ncbi:DNA polymerase III subunit psi [Vibrio viridaestus]|uniref:DNA polymerase III subunit psi n=1 Tax=Vibrio viridaestus TaxID=2487322 RepID=A0A3N9TI28_9VIBR|nr:DNA polymerase III subunit psi [Vibrio viridaestus]RQW63871.1 DNA polymerase III subunit psi [Vibrio viridaestus]